MAPAVSDCLGCARRGDYGELPEGQKGVAEVDGRAAETLLRVEVENYDLTKLRDIVVSGMLPMLSSSRHGIHSDSMRSDRSPLRRSSLCSRCSCSQRTQALTLSSARSPRPNAAAPTEASSSRSRKKASSGIPIACLALLELGALKVLARRRTPRLLMR